METSLPSTARGRDQDVIVERMTSHSIEQPRRIKQTHEVDDEEAEEEEEEEEEEEAEGEEGKEKNTSDRRMNLKGTVAYYLQLLSLTS